MKLEKIVEILSPDGTDYSSKSLRLVVVTPLANEECTIQEQLTRTLAQLGTEDRIFCVVDGACKDSTLDRVKAYGRETDPRVVLVWAPENRCVVDAYFAGYEAALKTSCRWILEMDGGLSHCPEEIPRFITSMEDGAEFAAGSRFCKGGSYKGPLKRYLLSRGGSLLAQITLGTIMKDMCSGFECFNRATLRKVVRERVRSRAHFFQTEIRFMLRDYRWVEVPISYSSPSDSVGSGTIIESLRNLWSLRRTRGALASRATDNYEEEPQHVSR